MPLSSLLPIISLTVGILASGLLLLFRRFGPGSWTLGLFLLIASLASGALGLTAVPAWTIEEAARLSLILFILAAPAGVMVSYTINRQEYLSFLRQRRYSTGLMIVASPLLVLSLTALAPSLLPVPPAGHVALGFSGYLSALYLVILSVIVLANLEQTLRSAHENVRWEIKFLLIGLAAVFAAVIYIASKILLYPPSLGLLPVASMQLFPPLFLCSCLLILFSWKRSSGRSRVAVSPGVIYSTITLVGVGIYLIASYLIASWASRWGGSGMPAEAILFFLALLALAVVLLWTDFRHRVKRWIRRHLLAGRYDYRQYWLEANERIQSLNPPETTGEALVDIVQKALGSIHASVWMRLSNPNRLKLLAARGDVIDSPGAETNGIVERFY